MHPGNPHRIPHKDPVSGGALYVSELSNDESGISLRGRFEVPRYSRLDDEQSRFLETFLRCRGMFNAVERELGISYPTVKSRLESLLQTLELSPIESRPAERAADKDKAAERRAKILDGLAAGEITPEEAKQQLRAGA